MSGKNSKSPDDFTGVPDWLSYRQDFTCTEKLCYSRMRRYCLAEGYGWASQETLALEIGCSVRKIRDCVRKFLALKMITIVSRGPATNRFSVHIPPQFGSDWKQFRLNLRLQAAQKRDRVRSELNWTDVGSLEAEIAESEAETAGHEAETASETAQTARKERSEDTDERNREKNQSDGELRSPGNSSLRSPFLRGPSFTEDPSLAIFSPQLDNAPDAVTLPQPPIPEIVSQPAPTFVAGEPVLEDDVRDDGRTKEEVLASLRMVAKMTEHKRDAQVAKNEAKKREKNKRALANGELPKVKVPKPKIGGILLGMQDLWLGEYRKKFPNDVVASRWTEVQGAQIKSLIGRYSVEDVERAVRYFIRYWDVHQGRFFKKSPPLVPTLGLFCKLHETLMPEAGRMFVALKAKMDYQEWCKKNPVAFRAPDDLQAAYDAALPSLKALGL